jgi:hypothetical protein
VGLPPRFAVCVLLREGGFEGRAKSPPSGFFVSTWKAVSMFAGPSYSTLTSFSSFLPSSFCFILDLLSYLLPPLSSFRHSFSSFLPSFLSFFLSFSLSPFRPFFLSFFLPIYQLILPCFVLIASPSFFFFMLGLPPPSPKRKM